MSQDKCTLENKAVFVQLCPQLVFTLQMPLVTLQILDSYIAQQGRLTLSTVTEAGVKYSMTNTWMPELSL